MKKIIGASVRDFGRCWKRLFLTGICYQIITLIVLTPLVSVLFRIFVGVSGKTILADQDILLFFLTPLGWACLITVGGLWLGILALQMAAMMTIVADPTPNGMRTLGALRFAMVKSWPTIQLAARVAFWTSVSIAPFLAVAALVYVALLGKFDINFYLTNKPRVFYVALGIGAVILVTMFGVLLRSFTGWAFALPMVLFENVRPGKALGLSQELAIGQRRKLLFWIVGWLLATFVLSAVTTSVVIWAASYFVARATGSLEFLSIAIGVTLIVWSAVNLAVSLLSTSTLATFGFNLYERLGRVGKFDSPPLVLPESNSAIPGIQLTRGRLLAACFVGLFVAMVTGFFMVNSISLEDQVSVVGHRGSPNLAPENTVSSVRQAIADGADWVEIDVQETADGSVVVFHDSDFMKTAGVNLKIWNATLNDLKDIDVGSWFAPEFKDERVPTLGEVLDECKKGRVGLFIELKYYGHDIQLEQRVVDVVEAHGMVENVIIGSLKVDAILKVKALRPKWKTALLMSVSAGNLAKIDADILAVNASFVSRSFIRSANRAGKDVCVWTVNDPVTMSTMISLGVNSIFTDKPALARSVLEQRAAMSAPERLMLALAELLGVPPKISDQ